MKMSDILRKMADVVDAESVSANNTASRTRPVDVRTQVSIGEFIIGPGMSFVAVSIQ